MTVCIAALSDSGKGLVAASDRMATVLIGGIKCERQDEGVNKIWPIPSSGFVLLAGSDSLGPRLITSALKIIADKKIERIEDIVEVFRQEYQKSRLRDFEQSVLNARGFTFANYYDIHQKLAPDLRGAIDTQMGNWSGLIDLIVAGKGDDGVFHLYSVMNPGVSTFHDATGYVCIGSGGPLATYSLIGSSYKKSSSQEEVKQIVEEAKKKSEVSPGVGSMTDLRTSKVE